MRLDPTFVMRSLFQDIHPVHVKTRLFCMRALSHRLMCSGWENIVNQYEPRQQVLLATVMAQTQHDALIREAHKRGDDTLKSWLEEHAPHVFVRAAA